MANYSWIGGDADWSDVDDWSPTGLPGVSDNATLPSNGAYTVTTSNARDVDDLVVDAGATLEVKASLEAFGSFENEGVVSVVQNATLILSGPFSSRRLGRHGRRHPGPRRERHDG
jgi:hypothetical protein